MLIDGLKFEVKPEDRARTKGGRGGGSDLALSEGEPDDRPGPAGAGRGGPGGRRPRGEGTEKSPPAGGGATAETPKKKASPESGTKPEQSTLTRAQPKTTGTGTRTGGRIARPVARPRLPMTRSPTAPSRPRPPATDAQGCPGRRDAVRSTQS